MASTDAERRVGTRFAERYELTRLIGEGGMGAVYQARHVFTNRIVALKIITAYSGDSESGRERFLREARAPSSIGHPALVEVFDAGVDEYGTCYLAMELLRGEGLDAAVDSGRLSRSRVVEIVVELLDALVAAHGAGMVHRDIKPENVFLATDTEGQERVKLLDFGISRIFEDGEASGLTTTGTVLGTPHYMSPEQARGMHVDQRTDIYSIGAMLFSILTGRTPFRASNYNLLVMAIMTGQAPAVSTITSDVPQTLGLVVDRALLSDPARRWQTAAEMKDALLSCPLQDGIEVANVNAIETAPTLPSVEWQQAVASPASSPEQPAKRRWIGFLIAAGAAVILVGAFLGTLSGLDAFRREPVDSPAAVPTPVPPLAPSRAAPTAVVNQPTPESAQPTVVPDVASNVTVRGPPTGALVGSIETDVTESSEPISGTKRPTARKNAPVIRVERRTKLETPPVVHPRSQPAGGPPEARRACFTRCHMERVDCVTVARRSELPNKEAGRCSRTYVYCTRGCSKLQ